MPDSELHQEALRLERIEHTYSSLDKLSFEQMVEEIESLTALLRPLLSDIEKNWPEFSGICAQLRGFSFNAFSLCHKMYMKQSYSREAKAKSKASTLNVNLEDLGL